MEQVKPTRMELMRKKGPDQACGAGQGPPAGKDGCTHPGIFQDLKHGFELTRRAGSGI